jgi:hypothetical protein
VPAKAQPAPKGPKNRRVTREESARIAQRLAQLCADDTPAAEIQLTLNREFQVNRHRNAYCARARRLGLKWPERNRPFPAQKCYLAGCERAGTGNLHHAGGLRAIAVKGTDGGKTVLIHPMSCGFDNPQRTLHAAYLGPHGEQLTPLLNEKTGKRKPGCWTYTDTKSGERIETESSHARAMRRKETKAKFSKASKRAWKKHRETRLPNIRAANRDPIRRGKIKAKLLERYGDPKAPETWTPEQQKAREDTGKTIKAFWDGLTPAKRRRQVKRRTAGSHRPEVQEKQRKHKVLWWAKLKAKLKSAGAVPTNGAKSKGGAPPKYAAELLEAAIQTYPKLPEAIRSWPNVAKKVIPTEWKKDATSAGNNLRRAVEYHQKKLKANAGKPAS